MAVDNKHLFAVFTPHALTVSTNNLLIIKDDFLFMRFTKVLRLRANDRVILFNGEMHVLATLGDDYAASKNCLKLSVVESHQTVLLEPKITLLQAMPKKPVFETIIYNAAQLGVDTIIPVQSEKSHELAFSPKEVERFSNIMIAACEQAKQFKIPKIMPPQKLIQGLDLQAAACSKILFDSTGKPFQDCLTLVKQSNKIAVLFGSEGGFTSSELDLIQHKDYQNYKLTPTILRSEEAPLVAIGAFRCMIHSKSLAV